MTKKKKVILLTVLAVILVAAMITLIVRLLQQKQQQEIERIQESQQQETEKILESYYRQNYAFGCGYSGIYNAHRSHSTYMSYNTINSENDLYAFLLLYEHDTGNVLTLEEVQDYLSQEYEDDGSLRLSSSYPKIQSYIDFRWKLYEEYIEQGLIASLSEDYPGPCSELQQFGAAIHQFGQQYLPLPYCVEINLGYVDGDDIIYISYTFDTLPKEQVKQLVDWVFESGWMDVADWQEWVNENPPAIDTYAIDWEEALASGEKPVEELSDEVWNEWVLQYNEVMGNSAE